MIITITANTQETVIYELIKHIYLYVVPYSKETILRKV